ncbi:MAG: PepSY domain-containing protein, partial [Candidatus Competibacterales bacterium]|nr:PepSY domain-containing protein [Candidatus Competibacterales bacterium]
MPRDGTRILVALLLLIAGSVAASGFDHDTIRLLRQQGQIVPLDEIIADATRRYSEGRLLEAELDHEPEYGLVYEIKFLDGQDRLRELYYNARSGELLIYEIYEIDAQGRLREYAYDARTGQLLAD